MFISKGLKLTLEVQANALVSPFYFSYRNIYDNKQNRSEPLQINPLSQSSEVNKNINYKWLNHNFSKLSPVQVGILNCTILILLSLQMQHRKV